MSNTFAIVLGERVEAYITLRRSLGYSLDKQAAILRELVRYVAAEQLEGPLCRSTVLGFIFSREGTMNGRAVRYGVVRRFSEYFAISEPSTEPLDPKALPRCRAIPPLRILTDDELTRLMAACSRVSPDYPERGKFLAPLVGLLASTGLRSGEALHLDCGDVEFTTGVLHIRRTKFRKDRLVPVHPSMLAALRDYARHRDATFPARETPAFFISSRGTRLSPSGLKSAFNAASSLAALDEGGKLLRPHDLRHRFAVKRLAIWHQERADVRALLPLLATYLGHARYTDTAYYVTADADLLAMAAERALARGGAIMSGGLSFPSLLESFFRHRLAKQRNASSATISSYRDALRMLILFAADRARCAPCALTIDNLDRDTVLAFLDDLETTRANTIQTRNARLAAIRSFFHHVAASDPASLGIAHRILAIPIKRAHIEVTHHLTRDELDALIDAPDRQIPRGRRDRTLLLFLGRTGARVSEALSVNVCDLQLDRTRPQVLLRGKGRKERVVPISVDLAGALRALITEHGLGSDPSGPIFRGTHGERLTRFGATHVVRRAVAAAGAAQPGLAQKVVSPHVLRHTLAMTLLQSGVDLLTIQAWLGHSQVATTHRYATADVEMMRRGLDHAAVSGKQPARFKAKDAILRLLESV